MTDLKKKKILLTGGAGFLGSFVYEKLQNYRPSDIFIPRSKNCDLRIEAVVHKLMQDYKPDIVLHLAANVGGIGANRANPGRFFYDNLAMGLHLIEEARKIGVEKFVNVGTICAYPKFTPVPFKEEHLWDGYPEETNAPYGIAKKALLVQCQSYRQQYGMNAIYLLPVNLYGPRDNFDLESSHVIPALIRKCVEAKRAQLDKIVVWGTGNATREFLYVEDCAEAIIQATIKYDGAEPVNVGSGMEISIKNLVQLICNLIDFKGKIEWDTTKPDGQPRRCLDISRAIEYFGWKATT
ncbi:MAG TPA: GDP-L-fucose synthase, partial [bacterium]|nr:GDP-L-fucose synthase [bacterium]